MAIEGSKDFPINLAEDDLPKPKRVFPTTTVFTHEDCNLVEYDMSTISPIIEASVQACGSLLEIKPPVMVFGKLCQQNRDVGFFANPKDSYGYFYSRTFMPSQNPPDAIQQLLDEVNDALGAAYNGVLVNRYCDGEDYISDHQDDEKGLDPAGVLTISYGGERTFRIRDYKTKEILSNTRTKHMHALLMQGELFQQKLTHGIPKEPKKKGNEKVRARYSFTFRQHCKKNEEAQYHRLLKKRKRNVSTD